jgi:hypothetical protein
VSGCVHERHPGPILICFAGDNEEDIGSLETRLSKAENSAGELGTAIDEAHARVDAVSGALPLNFARPFGSPSPYRMMASLLHRVWLMFSFFMLQAR